MPFETLPDGDDNEKQSAEGYEEDAPSALVSAALPGESSQCKATPKEYRHNGGVDAVNISQSYRSAAYNQQGQYWDGSAHGNQWQYYNPSSDFYASHNHTRYYPPAPAHDAYYRRDYDQYTAAAQGHSYVQYPYHQHAHPPHSDAIARTPNVSIHTSAVAQPQPSLAIPSGLNLDHQSYLRSPKRISMDPNASVVTGPDTSGSLDSVNQNPKTIPSLPNANEMDDAWKLQSQHARYNPYEVAPMQEIEPAPLASSTNEYHYAHIYSSSSNDQHYPPPLSSSSCPQQQQQQFSNVDHVPLSSSSTKRSLSYAELMSHSHHPSTPYHEIMMDVKSSFEPDRNNNFSHLLHSNKTFVTPEHMSADQLPSPHSKDANSEHDHDPQLHHHVPFHEDNEDIHGGLVMPSPTSSTRSERYEAERKRKRMSTGGGCSGGIAGSESKRQVTDRKQLQSKAWYERFNDLKAYKEKHGDCLVPQKYPPNPR